MNLAGFRANQASFPRASTEASALQIALVYLFA